MPAVHVVPLKRASTLVVTWMGEVPWGHNYFTRQSAPLSALDMALLGALAHWTPATAPILLLAHLGSREHLARALLRLLDLGFVVAQGSTAAHWDARMEREWKWGPLAGSYHFGIKDPVYQSPHQVAAAMAVQVATMPSVPLYTTNEAAAEVHALGVPPAEDPLIAAMRQRRSYRGFDATMALPLAALRDCLFSGLAIVGFMDTPTPGDGPLPLTMTPSGGARNPYEAYVYARNVSALRPGVYHYSGLDSTLGLITDRDLPAISALMGGQDWFDAASAVILLVANFERSMWKYDHPTGLRVVLLEAGHIAQNILLVATARGLASAPTCALSDRLAERLCGLDPVKQAAIHAVALGPRSAIPSRADLPAVPARGHAPPAG